MFSGEPCRRTSLIVTLLPYGGGLNLLTILEGMPIRGSLASAAPSSTNQEGEAMKLWVLGSLSLGLLSTKRAMVIVRRPEALPRGRRHFGGCSRG